MRSSFSDNIPGVGRFFLFLPSAAMAVMLLSVVMLLCGQALADDCCEHLGQKVACPQNLPPGSRSVQFVPGGTQWVTPSGSSVTVPQTNFAPCSTPAWITARHRALADFPPGPIVITGWSCI